jgi:hypothetical protein
MLSSAARNINCPKEYNLIVPLEAVPACQYNIQHRLNLELLPL